MAAEVVCDNRQSPGLDVDLRGCLYHAVYASCMYVVVFMFCTYRTFSDVDRTSTVGRGARLYDHPTGP
jgi:hypothetical protein